MKKYIEHCFKKGVNYKTICKVLNITPLEMVNVYVDDVIIKEYYALDYQSFINLYGLDCFNKTTGLVTRLKLPVRRDIRGVEELYAHRKRNRKC